MTSIVYDDQIFRSQQFGGISRYICEVAARIAERPGWSARIVAPLHFNEYLANSNVPHWGIRLDPSNPRTHGRCRRINSELVPPLLRLHSADLLHQTYYAPFQRPMHSKLIVTVHDMIHELFPQFSAATDTTSRDKRISVDLADHIICVSNNTADDLVRIFNVARAKISVIHHGFSPTFVRPTSDAPAQILERPYFLFVGYRGGYKNFARTLAAFATSPKLMRDFDLVVFGGDKFDAAEIAQIESTDLGSSFVRREVGSDADLARMYASAYAFVYPSEYEGFGIPLLEAMSSGCPVACSNTSSVPEVAGNAALYFDPTNVDAIRAALELLADDKVQRCALIDAGFRHSALFSWDRCADETAAVYSAVLNG